MRLVRHSADTTTWRSNRAPGSYKKRCNTSRPSQAVDVCEGTEAVPCCEAVSQSHSIKQQRVGRWKRRKESQPAAHEAPAAKRICSASVGSTRAKGAASSASTPAMYNALLSNLAQKHVQYKIHESLETMERKRAKDPDTSTLVSWLKAFASGGLVSCEFQKMLVQRASSGPALNLNMSMEI